MDQHFVLPVDAFVRSVSGNRTSPHAFFLGAGASVSSSIPTATNCIWRWKRDIFVTNNPDLEEVCREISLEKVRSRIQGWLDNQRVYPRLGADDEYSFYAERCHPIADNRRQFFRELSRGATPAASYRMLCLLAQAQLVSSIWTTNFDGLVPKAARAEGIEPIEAALDTPGRVHLPIGSGELLHVALHGDYRYDSLKNTAEELLQQEAAFAEALIERLKRESLVVIGYSGRDRSVMETLTTAYSRTGIGHLFWCGFEGEKPIEPVLELLRVARRNGREAFYIPTAGFDDVLVRLSAHILEGELLKRARDLRAELAARASTGQTPFRVSLPYVGALIKSNAFPIECPSEVLQFAASGFEGKGSWSALAERTRMTRVVAVPLKGRILALGAADDVSDLFEGEIKGPVERTPINGRDLSRVDGAIISLLTQGLVRSIASKRGFATDGKRTLWMLGRGERKYIFGQACQVHEAAALRLQQISGKMYMVLKPTIYVTDSAGDPVPADVSKEAKRQELGRQWNRQFHDALNRWRDRIFPEGNDTFECPVDAGSTFRYRTKQAPFAARLLQAHRHGSITLAPALQRIASYEGLVLPEPKLVFAGKGSSFSRDTHPLRGIVENRPYDFALTSAGLSTDVRIGIVCPRNDFPELERFLFGLHRPRDPESKQEYILAYPGFTAALNLPLVLPDPKSGLWYNIAEPPIDADVRSGAERIRRAIQEGVRSLVASGPPHVIVVYVPERWKRWEAYDEGNESFDLHDFIKAYCVTQGIATQFLREQTLGKRQQCEVMWWLALSLYVKAGRTPWLLDGLDSDTAFAGLGFGLDPVADLGKHVLIGCSHIYDSRGEGLTYRLSRLDAGFVDRQGSPFMGRDDARRMGDLTRQLFYEAHGRLPRRVVIHRRTPFRADEKEGLLEGLAGVESVDMLEIAVDPMLRCVAGQVAPSLAFEAVNFPVRRGTAVVLEGRRALVWAHGITDPVVRGRNPYYQGKSRIPAPLVVTRHHGNTNLDTLASEILGLSKMGLNSFDMYSKMPATLESSNTIARIGRLLNRFAPASFDYRFFI